MSATKKGKIACPVSRQEFREKAQPVTFTILGMTFTMAPREFETLSLGWNSSQKITVRIDGKDVTAQLGLNLTLVGSKELPK